jgi:hypothetical protein
MCRLADGVNADPIVAGIGDLRDGLSMHNNRRRLWADLRQGWWTLRYISLCLLHYSDCVVQGRCTVVGVSAGVD